MGVYVQLASIGFSDCFVENLVQMITFKCSVNSCIFAPFQIHPCKIYFLQEAKCKIHMKSFSNADVFKGTGNVKKQLHIIRSDSNEKVDLFSSGVGGHLLRQKMNEVFNVKWVIFYSPKWVLGPNRLRALSAVLILLKYHLNAFPATLDYLMSSVGCKSLYFRLVWYYTRSILFRFQGMWLKSWCSN